MMNSNQLRVGYSRWKLLGYLIISIAFIVICAYLAIHGGPKIPQGSFTQFAMYCGVVLCGLTAIFSCIRFFTNADVLILTPTGLIVKAISAQEIRGALFTELAKSRKKFNHTNSK